MFRTRSTGVTGCTARVEASPQLAPRRTRDRTRRCRDPRERRGDMGARRPQIAHHLRHRAAAAIGEQTSETWRVTLPIRDGARRRGIAGSRRCGDHVAQRRDVVCCSAPAQLPRTASCASLAARLTLSRRRRVRCRSGRQASHRHPKPTGPFRRRRRRSNDWPAPLSETLPPRSFWIFRGQRDQSRRAVGAEKMRHVKFAFAGAAAELVGKLCRVRCA